MKNLILLLFFFIAINTQTLHCLAQESNDNSNKVLLWEEDTTPASATLDEFSWLQGNWKGPIWDNNQQHVVLSPQGSQMPGFARGWTKEGDVIFYEINAFVEVEGSVEFWVKHISGEFSAWEGTDGYIRHRLIKYSDGTFYFDGITFEKTGLEPHTVYFRIPEGEQEGEILVVNQTRTTL